MARRKLQGMASEDELQALHRLVATKLVDQLNREDVKASDLANAIKFLKDQGITLDKNGDVSAITEMISSLPDIDMSKVKSYINA
ncbi:hypothetical protein PRRG_00011 [Prochlorococcus phage P-RSP2]|jgi:hypothetical protein|nr:hypothetical protein PRRG_00011 [Prochlorococcus phage P-RSP2]|tara:strand:+ start:744 stop:998 length:255 start_codon:yes stop_codon:yes gene_type:complete